MMSKIRKLQDTWLAKSIFILTALSFMSLFGISGYIGSAGRNRTVIKVDDIEISQSEISYKYEKQMQMARNIFGSQLELNDEIRSRILLGIVRAELVDAILKTTAKKNNIVIGDDLIRKIIYGQPAFMNSEGKFDINRFQAALRQYGVSEQEYVSSLRMDMQKRILADNPAQNVNVPDFITTLLGRINNQKRIFRYISIVPDELKIDRPISDDELQQYYHDFNDNFIAPETRDVSYIVISADEISQNYQPTPDEIAEYYKANSTRFETPEKRNVLQMVFNSEDEAVKAKAELDDGRNFYAVAKEYAGQEKEDTNLGEVPQDMLLPDIGEEVFKLKKGETTQPLKSELGWHILKVTDIIPAQKMERAKAEKLAAEAVRKEKAYDAVQDFTQNLEDKIKAGETLENLAKELKTPIKQAKGLKEEVPGEQISADLQELTDNAFSYNPGELSKITETDTGLLIVRVDGITDSHLLDIDEVKPQIEKMWAENERDIIAQEFSNDIMNDLEEGGSIEDAARRFGLKLQTTSAISRNENFEGLSVSAMNGLFQLPRGTAKMIETDRRKIIAVTSSIINDSHKLSEEEKAGIKRQAAADIFDEASNALIDNYAKGYDVRVKYRLLGLAD